MNRRLDRGITESNVMDSARHLAKILIIIPCRVKHLWIWKLSAIEHNFLFSYMLKLIKVIFIKRFRALYLLV